MRAPDAADHGHLRATVEGRSDDVLRWKGIAVHPLVVRSVLVKAPSVDDYQVRQTRRGIALDVVAADVVDLERLRAELERALAVAGLPQPEVVARAVDRLERHPETGKLRRFVPA